MFHSVVYVCVAKSGQKNREKVKFMLKNYNSDLCSQLKVVPGGGGANLPKCVGQSWEKRLPRKLTTKCWTVPLICWNKKEGVKSLLSGVEVK